jgi:hypothetical protein
MEQNIMLINKDLKIYEYQLPLTISNEQKEQIYNDLSEEFKDELLRSRERNYKATNFEIRKNLDFFNSLYDLFLEKTNLLFSNLTVETNDKKCWAFLTSVDHKNEGLWHDHKQTSTINSVFYFSVPDSNSGKLIFGDNNRNTLYEYQPVENHMLIFPNTLLHCPTSCNSKRFRIAINMELTCKEDVWS